MDRAKLYDYSDGSRFQNRSAKDVFTEIEKGNIWEEGESVSGIGSSLIQAKTIIEEIPRIISQFEIKSIFDIPCGDFNWFKEIDLSGMVYLGGDIVESIIRRNNEKYKTDNINFIQFNLIEEVLNKADMVLCRDCLVHFSISDIWKALTNIQQSNSTYLMTTTFPEEDNNKDIITGGWRPLNFLKAPFNFPEPLAIINENCTEKDGLFSDKSLGIWKISELNI